jgi:hypothetical protein
MARHWTRYDKMFCSPPTPSDHLEGYIQNVMLKEKIRNVDNL